MKNENNKIGCEKRYNQPNTLICGAYNSIKLEINKCPECQSQQECNLKTVEARIKPKSVEPAGTFNLKEKGQYCVNCTFDEDIYLKKDVKEFIRLRDILDERLLLKEITYLEHKELKNKLSGGL